MPKNMVVDIDIKLMPFWKRFIRFPFAMKAHYKLFRKKFSFIKSVYASWLMAGLTIKVK